MPVKKKVIVAISGGVDSAVAAYLLKEANYDVEAVFMRNWDALANNDYLGNDTINDNICPQEQDYLDAQAVCQSLAIPLHRIDFVEQYWNEVFTNFLSEYQKGRTPNPDILCNKYIKFDHLLNYALNQLKGDFLATGHYAKIVDGQLYQATDSEKDQSYFLAQLSAWQLQHVLFPLADLTKTEVRQIAQKLNLKVAQKKDSTGICFIGERRFEQFLQNYLPAQPGQILDIETKKVIGQHVGIMYYTIGQRKGLNLGGMSEPYFLAAKNIDQALIYAAPLSLIEKYLSSDTLTAMDLNLNTDQYDLNHLSAKFRYRQKAVKVKVEFDLKRQQATVYYEAHLAVTPGQQVVFYDGQKCIGGAVIDEIYRQNKKINLLNFE